MTKSVLLITLLVTIITVSQVNAQLLGGVLPPLGGALQLINITGQVSCSPNATAGVNGTTTAVAPFANAVVQLICGSTVVGSTTTTTGGLFTILLNPTQTVNLLGINLGGILSPVQGILQSLLGTLLSPACKLVVPTPLSACNPSLPSTGGLTSPLTLLTTVVQGITSLGAAGFTLPGVV